VELQARRFDLLLSADRSAVGGALAMRIEATEKRGFGLDPRGAITPLDDRALYLYRTGLDDELKFRGNTRTQPEMLAEALGFPYHRDPYVLVLGEDERAAGPRRKVGFNTGCSPAYPYKKLPLPIQAEAIRLLHARLGEPVLLLGGPEDSERNAALKAELGTLVEETPTGLGLRRGAAEVDRCEVVVSGDSLGLHLAIALGKHVVAWFGVSCPQEIEVYGRGIRLLAEVGCAPCWRKSCDREPKCFDRVDPAWIASAVLDLLAARSASRPIDEVRGAGWWSPR
jgi:heptosyltransferase-2